VLLHCHPEVSVVLLQPFRGCPTLSLDFDEFGEVEVSKH